MKLRPRLALTVVVAAIPTVGLVQILRVSVEHRAAVLALAVSARGRMEAGGRELCESDPESFRDPPVWPGLGLGGQPEPEIPSFPDVSSSGPPRRPRIEMFAYGRDFTSANPAAAPFPERYRRALLAGEREVGQVTDEDDRREIEAAVRMAWDDGPCAYMLAWRHDERPPSRPMDEILYAGAIVGALLLAVMFAAGPVARRVRRLAAGVERSASERYRETVRIEGQDEIADLARAFNAAGAEVRDHIEVLSARERSLRDFVENTTHDVMLPLTVLQGHLCALRDAVESGKPAASLGDAATRSGARANVREALEELDYLASLLQNLSAAAKLEAGEPAVRRDRFPWNALVERVVLRHKTIAREREVELDFAVPEAEVSSFGDVTLVEQALSNVVHNAVRYNRAGGHVAVVLEVEEGRFAVRVLDDGPGVPFAELARIVERTFRGDAARARHPGGTGLGLAIAKSVADRHGFAFEIRRAETGGLEVLIRGPAASETRARRDPPA